MDCVKTIHNKSYWLFRLLNIIILYIYLYFKKINKLLKIKLKQSKYFFAFPTVKKNNVMISKKSYYLLNFFTIISINTFIIYDLYGNEHI